jgi:hypothetical protein
MKVVWSSILSIILLASLAGIAAAGNPAQGTIPTFTIVSVVPDVSVTIQTANFPANQSFVVSMGKFGTLGVNGIQVGTTDSGSGGSLTEIYSIPSDLQGQKQIAIRLQSNQGFFSYNWFTNLSSSTGVPTQNATPVPTSATPVPVTSSGTSAGFQIPTFTITNVIPDQQVTIQTANFPANQIFRVTMGKFGTLGKNGILVDQTDSGSGGSFIATYTIPPDFAGQSLIAIRLQSDQGFFSYNWFSNQPPVATPASVPAPNEGAAIPGTPAPTATPSASDQSIPNTASSPPPTTAGKVPTVSIVSVVKDQSVTIQTSGFPAEQTLTVSMGAMGTQGVNGVNAGQTVTGSDGSAQATLTIPAELQGKAQVAIRLQSPQGFFAFNWFWNSTAP